MATPRIEDEEELWVVSTDGKILRVQELQWQRWEVSWGIKTEDGIGEAFGRLRTEIATVLNCFLEARQGQPRTVWKSNYIMSMFVASVFANASFSRWPMVWWGSYTELHYSMTVINQGLLQVSQTTYQHAWSFCIDIIKLSLPWSTSEACSIDVPSIWKDWNGGIIPWGTIRHILSMRSFNSIIRN